MKAHYSLNIFLILILISFTSNSQAQTVNTNTTTPQQQNCLINNIYQCNYDEGTICPCNLLDKSFTNDLIVSLVGFISIASSAILFVIFLVVPKLRESPGDIILGLVFADFLISIPSFAFGFTELIFELDSSYSESQYCFITSSTFVFGSTLQFIYNLSFFMYLIQELGSTLKAQFLPNWAYHAIPWLVSILNYLYILNRGQIGMGINGACSIKTQTQFYSPLIASAAGITTSAYAWFFMKKKAPNSEKIAEKIISFLNYYALYTIAFIILELITDLGSTLSSLALRDFIDTLPSNKVGYIEDANGNGSGNMIADYKTLGKVGSLLVNITTAINPFVLTLIRFNDPAVKPFIGRIFGFGYTQFEDDYDGEDENEEQELELRMSHSVSSTPYKQKLVDQDMQSSSVNDSLSTQEKGIGPLKSPKEGERKQFKKKLTITAIEFESQMQKQSDLRQIQHTMKVQLIYSILSSIHYFWETREFKPDGQIELDLGSDIDREAINVRKIKMNREILKEKLPFLENQITKRQFTTLEGELTVYAPMIFKEICNMDAIGRDIIHSLDLDANFRRILRAGNNTRGGRSGEFFFFSSNNKVLIKTISNSEKNILLEILPHYLKHYQHNPHSLIQKIYGLFTFVTGDDSEEYNLILMRNANGFPTRCIERAYDLKGSTVARRVIKEGKEPPHELKYAGTLKDLDFMRFEGGKMNIQKELKHGLCDALQKDAEFLAKFHLIDYSLILLVVDHKKSSTVTSIQPSFTEGQLQDIQEVNDDEEAKGQPNEISHNKSLHIVKHQSYDAWNPYFIMKSDAEDRHYHVGIIDYLTKYGIKKKSEHFLKKLFACNPDHDISVQPPDRYSSRFIKFVRNILCVGE